MRRMVTTMKQRTTTCHGICYCYSSSRQMKSFFCAVNVIVLIVTVFTFMVVVSDANEEVSDRHNQQVRRLQVTGSVGEVLGIRLINTDTRRPLFTITKGQTIRLPIPGATNFNFDAITTSITSATRPIGSVQFGYMNNATFNTESKAPYSVCGDYWQSGAYKICPKFVNNQRYTITATPYSLERGKGMKGVTYTVQFTVQIAQPPIATPTAPITAPVVVKAPTKAPIRPPSVTPVRPPIRPPTRAPIRPPIKAPIRPPTRAPILPPIKTPIRTPTRAPIRPPTKTPVQPSCRVPRLDGDGWVDSGPSYPIQIFEPQGLIIGNDMVLFSGFSNGFDRTTNRTYARDITIPNSVWRRMDDMPIAVGITHSARVLIGTRVYLCGGYVGGHPGIHTPNCFVYDHSRPMGQNQQWTIFARLPNGGSAGGGMVYDTEQNTLYYTGGGQRLEVGNPHPVDIDSTWKNTIGSGDGWVESTPIPYLANHLSYVTHTNSDGTERHFFLGGQEQEYECCRNLGQHYEFIPRTERWVHRASLPLPRSHTTASTRSIGCGYIIAGGSVNSGSLERERTDDISYYDIPNDRWVQRIGVLPRDVATPVVDIHRTSGRLYYVTGQPNTYERDIFT